MNKRVFKALMLNLTKCKSSATFCRGSPLQIWFAVGQSLDNTKNNYNKKGGV